MDNHWQVTIESFPEDKEARKLARLYNVGTWTLEVRLEPTRPTTNQDLLCIKAVPQHRRSIASKL